MSQEAWFWRWVVVVGVSVVMKYADESPPLVTVLALVTSLLLWMLWSPLPRRTTDTEGEA